MWHSLAFVAASRNVDTKELTEFALADIDRYGISDGVCGPEVNTWHVDALVRDFKANQSSEKQRQEKDCSLQDATTCL